jgi:hypothetical protein
VVIVLADCAEKLELGALGHHLDSAFFQGRLPGEGRAASQCVEILDNGRALRDERTVL